MSIPSFTKRLLLAIVACSCGIVGLLFGYYRTELAAEQRRTFVTHQENFSKHFIQAIRPAVTTTSGANQRYRNNTNAKRTVNVTETTVFKESSLLLLPERDHCQHRHGNILLFKTHYGGKTYRPADESVQCYASAMGYAFVSINLDEEMPSFEECKEIKDKKFLRHCVLAQYLRMNTNYSYVLASDGDVAVVNANHCVEDYIDSNASITFYERFHTLEVAVGSIIVKNDQFSYDFLMDLAGYERKVPRVAWGNADNGALLSLLLEKRDVAAHERRTCRLIWEVAHSLQIYMRYVHCVYIFIGTAGHRLHQPAERIRIVRRGHGWTRDGWVSDQRWCERDFMLHAVKEDDYLKAKTTPDQSPFSGVPIDLSRCAPNRDASYSLPMDAALIVSCDEVRRRFANRFIVEKQQPLPYLDDRDLQCWPNCDKEK